MFCNVTGNCLFVVLGSWYRVSCDIKVTLQPFSHRIALFKLVAMASSPMRLDVDLMLST